MKLTKAKATGLTMARGIISMVHLMYQNNTAMNFLIALKDGLQKEIDRREKETS